LFKDAFIKKRSQKATSKLAKTLMMLKALKRTEDMKNDF